MALTVTVENPDFPEDTMFTVSGLGEFKNGEAREITEEQEQAFVSERMMQVTDALKDQAGFKVTGTATAKVPEAPAAEETEEAPTQETNTVEGGES